MALSNNLKAALTLLEREIETTPGESKLWNALGNVLSMSGDRVGAINAYTRATELNPENKEAAINLQNLKPGSRDETQ